MVNTNNQGQLWSHQPPLPCPSYQMIKGTRREWGNIWNPQHTPSTCVHLSFFFSMKESPRGVLWPSSSQESCSLTLRPGLPSVKWGWFLPLRPFVMRRWDIAHKVPRAVHIITPWCVLSRSSAWNHPSPFRTKRTKGSWNKGKGPDGFSPSLLPVPSNHLSLWFWIFNISN